MLVPCVAVGAQGTGRLSMSDRALLAEARVNGLKEVVLVIASRPGSNGRVAGRLGAIGATVRRREDSVDYLSAIVPLDRAESVAAWPDVAAVNISAPIMHTLSAGRDTNPPVGRAKPPDASTPKENAYLPTRDIGAPQFATAHRTYDGRGAGIGILDTGLDLWVPELQVATTLDGQATRKIVDWRPVVAAADEQLPLTPATTGNKGDCEWVDMRAVVHAADLRVAFGGVSYTVPADQAYRIGVFTERQTCFDYWLKNDVNRDGNPVGSSGTFAVLWNEASGEVWVDANQNHDFRDEPPLTEYTVQFDVGHFGTDDPNTVQREAVPFVVHMDTAKKYVHLGFERAAHGELVAGTAAGRGFFDGAFDGMAPGAQLAVFAYGGNYYVHNVIEGLIAAARHPAVDVMQLALGGQVALNDGSVVIDRIVDRLAERYGKLLFSGAGNEDGALETVIVPAEATWTQAVGAYIGRESLLTNYGVAASKADLIRSYSAKGPREDGGFKPDFLVPSGGVVPKPLELTGDTARGGYVLSPGHRIGEGTSQSSGYGAGAGALLVSAARQAGVPYDAHRLRVALMNGTRWLSGYAAHEQGNGLLQMEEAWRALVAMHDAAPVVIESRAPVRTALSGMLETPNVGVGLYEREGWVAGARGSRNVTLTRRSGPTRAMRHRLEWVGNDGTFSSDSAVTLPLGVRVPVRVKIRPTSEGVHSAILSVVDVGTGLAVHRMLATVVASWQFERARRFEVTFSDTVAALGTHSHFFAVPPGVGVFVVAIRVREGPLRVHVSDPTGRYWSGVVYQGLLYTEKDSVWRRAFERPMPGVWEVVVARDRDVYATDWKGPGAVPRGEYELTARVVGAEIERGFSGVLSIKNRFAPIEGRLRSRAAWTRHERVSVTPQRSQRVIEIDVPAAAEDLIVDVEGGAYLYLFDCTAATCARRAAGTNPGQGEHVAVHRPTTGKWRAVLDGRAAVEYRQTIIGSGPSQVLDVVADGVDDFEAQPKANVPSSLAPLRSEIYMVRWPMSVNLRQLR
jgi:hypothetical protein